MMTTCTAPGCSATLDRRGRNRSGLCRRHALALAAAPEVRAKAVIGFRAWVRANPEKISLHNTQASRTRMAWCPPEYREQYHHLTRVKRLTAGEARALLKDMIARDARRYSATGVLPQFQRSEEKRHALA